MYVCNFLCALYNIHAPHGKSIFFSAIWYFYVHCDLVLFASEAHGICEFCLTNSASQDSWVSLWIYLFRFPYGSTCSLYGHMDLFTLYVGEISILRGTLYYNNRQRQQHQMKVLFLLWKFRIHPSSMLLFYCYLLLWHWLSIQFQLWTLDWRDIGSNFWLIVSQGYNFPFKFTLVLLFCLALLIRLSSGIPLAQASCFPLGSDMALECFLRSLSLLWLS